MILLLTITCIFCVCSRPTLLKTLEKFDPRATSCSRLKYEQFNSLASSFAVKSLSHPSNCCTWASITCDNRPSSAFMVWKHQYNTLTFCYIPVPCGTLVARNQIDMSPCKRCRCTTSWQCTLSAKERQNKTVFL